MIAKADKGKTFGIIDKNSYKNKGLDFPQDNRYKKRQKDPIGTYYKQTQKAMQDSNI
jgi:hypothetical protein